MSLWGIVPVRPLEEGKSRLADALSPAERLDLNEVFFRRTLRIVESAIGRDRTLVVSRSQPILAAAGAAAFRTLREESPFGLNAALRQAAETVRGLGATAVLSVSCDLPLLAREDLLALIDAAEKNGGLAIAGDDAGVGTNALVMSPVGAIQYLYGAGSFAAHLDAARREGLAIKIVRRPGLSFDVDTPCDLERMRRLAGLDRARA
jgi:2-phospho-L-lactate guanylyltransferase